MKDFRIQFLLVLIMAFVFLLSCDKTNSTNDYSYGHGFSMGSGAGSYEDVGSMQSSLQLNDAQTNKISEIDSKYRIKYYENRGDYDKIKSLRKEHKDEVENVLNENQKRSYNELYASRWGDWGRQHRRKNMGNYYGHGYGMGSGAGCFREQDGMMKELNLNKEQVEKISEIDSKYREKYSNNRGNYDKIESLRRAHKNEIDGVLTESQQEEFDDLYDYRWRGGDSDDRSRHMQRRGRGGHMMGW